MNSIFELFLEDKNNLEFLLLKKENENLKSADLELEMSINFYSSSYNNFFQCFFISYQKVLFASLRCPFFVVTEKNFTPLEFWDFQMSHSINTNFTPNDFSILTNFWVSFGGCYQNSELIKKIVLQKNYIAIKKSKITIDDFKLPKPIPSEFFTLQETLYRMNLGYNKGRWSIPFVKYYNKAAVLALDFILLRENSFTSFRDFRGSNEYKIKLFKELLIIDHVITGLLIELVDFKMAIKKEFDFENQLYSVIFPEDYSEELK